MNGNFRHFYPPPGSDLNLSAHVVSRKGAEEQLVFPEPWDSGFNDTKVPALFASNYNRIPADAVRL